MSGVMLTDQERRALNAFVEENYHDFQNTVERFLNAEEIQELEEKLSKE